MKKIVLFRKLDPRLAADMRKQRRTILIGLVCVAIGSILDLGTLALLPEGINTIQRAAPVSLLRKQETDDRNARLKSQADSVAAQLNLPVEPTEKAFIANADAIEGRQANIAAEILAAPLAKPQQDIQKALLHSVGKDVGNVDEVHRLGVICLLVVAVFAAKYWFTRGQAYYLTKAAIALSSDMRERLFAKLQRLPVSYFSGKRVGAIQSVLTNDVNVYQNAVTIIRDSIDAPIKALGSLIIVFWTQWQLGVVALLFLPFMVVVIGRNSKKMRVAQTQVQDDLSELSASTNESLQGMRVIKAFSAEGQIQKQYRGLVGSSFDSQMEATRRFASLRPLVELIGACAVATVIYVCGWLSYMGQLQIGQIARVIWALDKVNQGFKNFGNVTSTYSQVQAATDRLYSEVLDVPEQTETEGARILEAPVGHIEFRNVTFRYPDGTEALNKVSFTIPPGTSLALVGPSGAGKSTIADLLLRFYDPSEGQILFDGVDIRELRLGWLRNHIGVVPQATFLFAGSIADNIRMGKPDATQAEIAEAARLSHADEFVDQMEHGYASDIGEGGARISGGQRQRLAIARALVRKPTILLLDEATSALDATSEKAVTEALDEVMEQRTTLFIAHRLTTAARANRILVLARGQAIESGSHAELLEANGAYAGLFRAFSGGVLD